MKAFRLALCALVFAYPTALFAQTRAVIIEESARLAPPDASWSYFGRFGIAIDGDYALVSAERFVEDPEAEAGQRHDGVAFLYQRVGSAWQFRGPLGGIGQIDEWTRPGLAMKDGVAMVITANARVYERVGTQWTEAPITPAYDIQGADIEIDNGRILVSRTGGDHTSFVYSKVGTTWQIEGTLPGHSNDGGDSPPSSFQDLQGERAIVFNEEGINYEPPVARLFRRNESGTGWRPLAVFENPGYDSFYFGSQIAMSGPYIAIPGSIDRGTSVLYEVNQSWSWSQYGLQPADAFMDPTPGSSSGLERAGPLFAQRNYSINRAAYVFNLFRVNADLYRTNTHVVTLQTRNGTSLGSKIDVSRFDEDTGMRAIALGADSNVRIFDIPNDFSHPPVRNIDFDAPSDATWNYIGGANFQVVSNGESNVLRQTSTTVDGGAWLGNGLPRDQSIQAEVTIRSVNGADRWAGLMTRYATNAETFYYVTLRASGSVQLRRMLNGTFTTLATAPLTVTLGRKYRLRLESIGSVHRVYVDDRPVLLARDESIRQGAPGLRLYRTVTDYDNVIATPAPFTTIYSQDFATAQPGNWSELGQWQSTGGVYRQTSSTGDARSFIGAATADQIVQVRVRPLTFSGGTRWVGVMARYEDNDSYLYVSLRNNNVLSLRRVINGQIQVIAERPYAFNSGTWYTVRIEIVNGLTRVFVNNRMEIATSADPGPAVPNPADARGKVGLVTYRATAEYDDFLAYQP